MGEKTGLLFTIAIFAMFILPLSLDILSLNISTYQFLNTATEMKQLITEEGGITARVKTAVDSSRITYTFKNEAGNVVDGRNSPGEVLYIDYQYDWKGIFSEETLKTSNSVRISRR